MLSAEVCWLIKNPRLLPSNRLRLLSFICLWWRKIRIFEMLSIYFQAVRFIFYQFVIFKWFWVLYWIIAPYSRFRGRVEHLLRKLVATDLLLLYHWISGTALVKKWIISHWYKRSIFLSLWTASLTSHTINIK